jgi:nucleoporin NUP1
MMASSLPSSTSSRDGQQAPKLVRHNSSFLGAIKNIVIAPLSWFGNVDGGADVTGSKRRRPESESGTVSVVASGIQEEPTEIIIEEQSSSSDEVDQVEASRRSKRMRLSSPSSTMKATTKSKSAMRRSSVVPRASSAVLPSSRGASRATLSPKRNTRLYPPAIQRTMSIDPPQLASYRDTPSSSFNFGVDVDMAGLDTRDISMPPSPSRLSPRPSFRMRSSMTPQPVQNTLPQRHISEPPPLSALFSNPVFVHPPLQEKEETSTPAPVPTLGTLVESARSVCILSSFLENGTNLFL